ncbi:hypothetical protein KQX54_001877 [Cotesia glomerata]|uniref:Uncharacterized protein n=1 Tax=Cotesia glomerata TaxID=32391 RepID=A0AAV7I7L0_COTGL|nr:hypothetical protein KQX54_001877 [Cotesia glomerata]
MNADGRVSLFLEPDSPTTLFVEATVYRVRHRAVIKPLSAPDGQDPEVVTLSAYITRSKVNQQFEPHAIRLFLAQ